MYIEVNQQGREEIMPARKERIVEVFTHHPKASHHIIEEILSDGTSRWAVAINQYQNSVRVQCASEKAAWDLAKMLSHQEYCID